MSLRIVGTMITLNVKQEGQQTPGEHWHQRPAKEITVDVMDIQSITTTDDPNTVGIITHPHGRAYTIQQNAPGSKSVEETIKEIRSESLAQYLEALADRSDTAINTELEEAVAELRDTVNRLSDDVHVIMQRG